MKSEKEILLVRTYKTFIDQELNLKKPDVISDIVSENAKIFEMIYDRKDTSTDSKFHSKDSQKKRTTSKRFAWNGDSSTCYKSADGNLAVFADDIKKHIKNNIEDLEISLRFSVVLEFTHDKWLVVHFHASQPESVSAKQQIAKLKKEVDDLKQVISTTSAALDEANRELQIEAALEKVRAVAVGLKKSDDMLEIAKVLYEQLLYLGFTDIRNAIIDIHNEDNETFWDYDYSHDMSGSITLVSYKDEDVIEKQLKKIVSNSDAFCEIVLEGKALQNLIDLRIKNGGEEDFRLRTIDQLTYNLYSFGNGAIGISNFRILTPDQKTILKRFRNVFTFAYKRYSELAKAELQARETEIELGVERVRSRAITMQKSEELCETSALLFRQIKRLAKDAWSCGFCIWQENESVELWMGADSGGLLPPMIIPYEQEPAHKDIRAAFLRGEKSYNKTWIGEELSHHYECLRKIPSVAVAIKIMEDSGLVFPTKQCYYVTFFNHGYLLLINKEPNDNLVELSKRFAAVFDLTYQRFLDLQVKENQSLQILAEKHRLEDTVSNLKTTQKQLIQSEKMASLGELTAGIAHEIQNPLNFVNNFADLSHELLDEVLTEIRTGNFENATNLIEDVKQNVSKINQHGRRAEAITKGMLQHSRLSNSKKELTNINKLADEYFKLAYHGLRAINSNFNANIITDFAEDLPLINIIPQEIGRVLLNIITNAFYTINEKKGKVGDEYQPEVWLSTKKLNKTVELKIGDNGSGIPDKILDKIFQPFFTTKPAGKGTGLGLSMSYDIIKTHGGKILVESKLGEGTTFIISLPITQMKQV